MSTPTQLYTLKKGVDYDVALPTLTEKKLMEEISEELLEMNWPKRWYQRTGVGNKDPNRKAFALGKVRKLDVHHKLVNSQFNKKYPKLFKMLKKLVKLHNPKFKYTTIQLNYNLKTEPHKDKNNVGISKALALGKFKKGGVQLFAQESEKPFTVIKNNRKWLTFDGSMILHGSEPIAHGGKRFPLIFFKLLPQRKAYELRKRQKKMRENYEKKRKKLLSPKKEK